MHCIFSFQLTVVLLLYTHLPLRTFQTLQRECPRDFAEWMAVPFDPHGIPDAYKEFGLTVELINFLPDDFFPSLPDLIKTVESLYGDDLDDKKHFSPHHTALRQLLVCYYHQFNFLGWLGGNLQVADANTVRGFVSQNAALYLRRAFWFHLSCLTFGDSTVVEFIISFGTWARTPAAYRPPNAPILSTMQNTANLNYIRGRRTPRSTSRGRSQTPRTRRSPSPRRRRSPSPRAT